MECVVDHDGVQGKTTSKALIADAKRQIPKTDIAEQTLKKKGTLFLLVFIFALVSFDRSQNANCPLSYFLRSQKVGRKEQGTATGDIVYRKERCSAYLEGIKLYLYEQALCP